MEVVIVEGKGQLWGEFWASHCNQWGFCCVVVRERRALPKLLWGGFVSIVMSTSVCLFVAQAQLLRESATLPWLRRRRIVMDVDAPSSTLCTRDSSSIGATERNQCFTHAAGVLGRTLHCLASHRSEAASVCSHAALGPITGKNDAILKTEVHNVLQRRQRSIEPRQWAACTEIVVKFGSGVLEICRHTDKQTVSLTHHNTPRVIAMNEGHSLSHAGGACGGAWMREERCCCTSIRQHAFLVSTAGDSS